ncbi:3' terminal RNA ribose 2'-O-methyltransferase Hen1 [uncultured Microscilla sp.]|uniref:3' terminal RNA ribose 2'-O-methyltransferase Hen1 n=1 Tax=uncultured Microscilla sp. TaxID=432653 RepID=UPI00260F19C2|nr:3' terminal RNA ribose 2'-O-methyltransferase Hen1 [uncultured Microscilla sp.]
MLLTITTTHQPTTDLGYLLHKHPDKFQSVALSIGKAHIFYPESTPEKTTVALLLDIDPIDMVRGSRNLAGKGFALGQYVNDRPYVASSFMSVALAKAFSTAMNGKCNARPALVSVEMPLVVRIAVLPAPAGGEQLIRKLFEPLGYTVGLQRHTLDMQFAQWGESKYYTLELTHTIALKDLLSHLYVLIPALDNDKHYYVSQGEIDKLLDKGKGWLEKHPAKEQITRRYLISLGSLAKEALNRLNEAVEDNTADEVPEEIKQKKQTLHQQRLGQVLEQLKKAGAKSVIDLGCGEGKLLKMLLKEKQFEKIAGMDVSFGELLKAKNKLYWDEMAPKQKERIQLFQGALTYRDKRLEGYDAAALVEVIEHLDESRLKSLERVVFELARPQTMIITTPNAEYNVMYDHLEAGHMRHTDHRFEWTREAFESWATDLAKRHNYTVNFLPIGSEEPAIGAPSQMGIFTIKKS